MKTLKQIFNNRIFRFGIVIFLLVFVATQLAPEKKQYADTAECNAMNKAGGINNVEGCLINDCGVIFYDTNYPTGGDIIGSTLNECASLWVSGVGTKAKCGPAATIQNPFLADSLSDANDLCGVNDNSGYKALSLGTKFCTKDWYRCVKLGPDDPGPATCNTAERSISQIAEAMGLNFDCKTNYYVTLFGGLMLFLVVIGL